MSFGHFLTKLFKEDNLNSTWTDFSLPPPPPTHDIYVITELFMLLFLSGADLSEAVDVYSDWIDACEQANA